MVFFAIWLSLTWARDQTPAGAVPPKTDTFVTTVVPAVDPLKGIDRVAVDVVGVDGDATSCGLSESAVRLAAIRPLLDGGIRVLVDTAPPSGLRPGVRNQAAINYLLDLGAPKVLVEVTAAKVGETNCSAFAQVSVYQFAPAMLQHLDRDPGNGPWLYLSMPVRVNVLHKGILLGGLRAGFAERVNVQVRDFVDEFVTQIKLANQAK